jgi:hypothetical protein
VPVPNVQWITPEDGQRNCPKHVEFRTRINLEISASVGFLLQGNSQSCFFHKHHRVTVITVFGHTVASYNMRIAMTFHFLTGDISRLIRSSNKETEFVFID